jgi:predicted RNase H-like HicB family nuclease
MKKVEIRIEQSPEGDWWASSPESPGFFAYGETRDEVIANSVEALSIFLGVDEEYIELEIKEEKI